jgi:formate-dependent phosphoribosylglycinamide formyltransferase (GAR transformylase)
MIKCVLVDTNRAAYTIYQSLVAQGNNVFVVGGNPQEPLAKICPNFIQLDYSDASALDALIEREGFNFIVPGCTDVSYKACAEVNRGRFVGIDYVEATRAINDKNEFRTVAERLGIPVPKVLDFEEALHCDAVIVKPVDSFSGRGITIVKKPTRESLQSAYSLGCEASKTRAALIEQFVCGQLYSHSAFLQAGKVVADFVVREDCTTNPFTVDTSKVVYDFPEK